ncbi:DUF4236 domain-containing protein [Salmonella enterica subsp. enterica]|nr:DUF4236 domain-containing protein [Salmonella enterica subsp. enterica]
MGFRFRKRIKLGKGVHLNVGKRGVSASVGAGGLSYNTRLFGKGRGRKKSGPGTVFTFIIWLFIFYAVGKYLIS